MSTASHKPSVGDYVTIEKFFERIGAKSIYHGEVGRITEVFKFQPYAIVFFREPVARLYEWTVRWDDLTPTSLAAYLDESDLRSLDLTKKPPR